MKWHVNITSQKMADRRGIVNRIGRKLESLRKPKGQSTRKRSTAYFDLFFGKKSPSLLTRLF